MFGITISANGRFKIHLQGDKDMFGLSKRSRQSVLDATGMTVEQIVNSDFDVIDEHIGRKVGHKISEYILDDMRAARGQVYASEKRFLSMDDVDKRLKKNDKRKSRFTRKSISPL